MCRHNNDQGADQPAQQEADALTLPPAPTFNPDEYLHHLDDFALTDAQKVELLQTLWNIMATMVDIGFGVDSVHYFLPELFEQQNEQDHEQENEQPQDTDDEC